MERRVTIERIVVYSGVNEEDSEREESVYDELQRIVSVHGIADLDVFYDMIRSDAAHETATNMVIHRRNLDSWPADYILNDIVHMRIHNMPLSSQNVLDFKNRDELMTWESLKSMGDFLVAMEIVEITNETFLMNRERLLSVIQQESQWRDSLEITERLQGPAVGVYYSYDVNTK